MYKIEISYDGKLLVELKTDNRNLARSVTLLCKENILDCKVEREAKAVNVKFKNV